MPSGRIIRETALTVAVAGVVVLFCAAFLVLDPCFFWTDDYQTYQLAGFCDIARAWSHGEVPLLSPYSWRGGALAGEYQYGVFSVFLTLCVVIVFGVGLSLPMCAAVLSIIHLAVLAAGAFRLARGRGLTVDLAMLVALIATLNGWIFIWGATAWFPALASFAWLPWAWWAMENADRRGWIWFLAAGFFLYLAITAGWPFTVLMLGVVTLWHAAKTRFETRLVWKLWPIAAAWMVGLGLSAPAWMMLLEYTPYTLRSLVPMSNVLRYWMVPAEALPGLVFPAHVTHWPVFENWKPHLAIELTGGLVPLAVIAASLRRSVRETFRSAPWDWALAGLMLLLITAPSVGKFQYSFRWLPLFFLALGLVTGELLAQMRTAKLDDRWCRPATWALAMVLVVWMRALIVGFDPTRTTLLTGLVLVAFLFLWARVEAGPRVWPRTAMPVMAVLVSCGLAYATFAPFREVPVWPFTEQVRRVEPLDPKVRYLSVHLREDMFEMHPDAMTHRMTGIGMELYPGSASMYAGVEFVNGYSPMMPAGLERLLQCRNHGFFSEAGAERILTVETAPDGLLALMGVDGLVVSDRLMQYIPQLMAHGWRQVATVEGGVVLHRDGPPSRRVRAVERVEIVADGTEAMQRLNRPLGEPVPLVLVDAKRTLPGPDEAVRLLAARGGSSVLLGQSEPRSAEQHFAPATVRIVAEGRNTVTVDVTALSTGGDVMVVFARPWFPGYRAFLEDGDVPVEVCNLALPAVRLPAGSHGRLVLEYRPRSLELGVGVAGLTLLGMVVLGLTAVLRTAAKRG